MEAAVALFVPLVALVWLAFFAWVTHRKDLPSPARNAFLLHLVTLILWTVGSLVAWRLASAPQIGPVPSLLAGLAMPAAAFLFTRAYLAWPLPRLAYGAEQAGLVVLGFAQYVMFAQASEAPALLALLGLYALSLLGLGAWLWVNAWHRPPSDDRRSLGMIGLGLIVSAMTAALYLTAGRSYALELTLGAAAIALAALVLLGRRPLPLPLPQRRSAGYALIGLLGAVLSALLSYGAHAGVSLAGSLLILSAGLMFSGVTVAFPQVADVLSTWVERASLRSQYDARRMIEEVAEAAPAVLDLEPLLDMILERTLRALDIRWGLFALWDRTSQDLRVVAAHGLHAEVVAAAWPRTHAFTCWLLDGQPEARDEGLAKAQLPAGPALDTAWVVPVRLREEAVGAFLYGPHTSGASYSTTECSILDLLANETAAAVANARLFNWMSRARREWLQTFDALSDSVFLHDRQGRILRANRAFARLVDRPLHEIPSQLWFELIPAGPEARQVCSGQAGTAGERAVSEYDLAYAGQRTLHVTVSPLTEGDDFCVHVVRDVTQERLLQQQLAQAEKLAAIGEMLSGVAHELNNPLTTIIGFSELLQDADVPGAVRSDLQRIYRQARHSSHIVQSLLAFARQSRIRVAQVDVNALLEQTLEFMQPRLESCRIRTVLELDERLPHTLADNGQLQQVFLNLFSNAVHAMAEAHGEGTLYLRTEATPAHIRITTSDDGPGIPQELMRRIFDPFFTTKSVGEGTGLGLSICYGIVREHGGRIWAESEPGKGATFYVELPLRHAGSEVPPAPAPAALQGRRILVVEDDEAILILLRRILVAAGADVQTALDGLQALEVLADAATHGAEPDLIVADLKMPRLDGPGLFARLGRERPHLAGRFLFISGDTIRPETARFLSTCGCPCVRKPFSPREIEQAIADMLRPSAPGA